MDSRYLAGVNSAACIDSNPWGRKQNEILKVLGIVTAALFALTVLIAPSSRADQAQELEWHRIFGIPEAFNIVGVGTGAVEGGAPWTTTSGEAEVDLKDGKIKFSVKGLVLAVGGNATAMLSGLDIGTPAGVTEVKGTLVCSVSGVGNGGNSSWWTPMPLRSVRRVMRVSAVRSALYPRRAAPAMSPS